MALSNSGASLRYPGATTTLFVSLYIILLAFFILLTSLGQPDSIRRNSVMESLRTAFPDGYPTSLRGQRGASEALARVEDVLRNRIDRLDVRLSGGGGRMEFGMRHTELFLAGSPDFSNQTPALVLRLGEAMRRGSAGENLAIGLEFAGAPEGRSLGRAQAARLAAALESAGIDPGRIAIMLDSSLPADRLGLTLEDTRMRRSGEAAS